MAEKDLTLLLKAFTGNAVTIVTRSGEKMRGTLREMGKDYILVQREQMAVAIVPINAIDIISG